MFNFASFAAKYKIFIALLPLLLIGGAYTYTNPVIHNPATHEDYYTSDIQERATLVNNAVLGMMDVQGKQEAWQYKQTFENTVSFIRKQNLDTDQVTTLTPAQRAVNTKFKAYLHEAFVVTATSYNGEVPDLTQLNKLKNDLN
jgi:hypothetical protein